MEKNIEELNQNIENLTLALKRSNSFYDVFARGVLWGLGSAVGATVIAVIVISILSNIIQTVNDVPILNNIMNNLKK